MLFKDCYLTLSYPKISLRYSMTYWCLYIGWRWRHFNDFICLPLLRPYWRYSQFCKSWT